MQRNSKKVYDTAIRQYTDVVPKDKALHEEGLKIFMEYLDKKGYSQNTKKLYHFAVLKTLKDMGVELKSEPPSIDEDNIKRHIYTNDEIAQLIATAKNIGGMYSKAFALSTVYGLRRAEICSITNEIIDINNMTIRIKPLKHGKTVTQAMPPEIVPYIDNNIKFCSISRMSSLFNFVADETGLNEPQAGWHSIRRALVSGLLLNKVPQELVLGFMRWKTRTILDVYHIRNPREDIEIFQSHPFIKMWR